MRTILLRSRISRHDKGNGRCASSSQPLRHSGFCRYMGPSRISSTWVGTDCAPPATGCFVVVPLRSGARWLALEDQRTHARGLARSRYGFVKLTVPPTELTQRLVLRLVLVAQSFPEVGNCMHTSYGSSKAHDCATPLTCSRTTPSTCTCTTLDTWNHSHESRCPRCLRRDPSVLLIAHLAATILGPRRQIVPGDLQAS